MVRNCGAESGPLGHPAGLLLQLHDGAIDRVYIAKLEQEARWVPERASCSSFAMYTRSMAPSCTAACSISSLPPQSPGCIAGGAMARFAAAVPAVPASPPAPPFSM